MGGGAATDDLEKGVETQTWLAVSNDDKPKVSRRYFYHKGEADYHPETDGSGASVFEPGARTA